MKPEIKSKKLLGITRSKAKMFEYSVPEDAHIKILQNPNNLFGLSIALLGDLAAESNEGKQSQETILALRNELLFSANFFDAYVAARFNSDLSPYLRLLGSAAYYLSDLPGSSYVLAKAVGTECPDIGGCGLENILHWLLRGETDFYWTNLPQRFAHITNDLSKEVFEFFQSGGREKAILKLLKQLRAELYQSSTPRQLLLGDVLGAIIRRKIHNSTWESLPQYSDISLEVWRPTLLKKGFLKELWPSQHLLGRGDLLKGSSAVIQMPTSAGKTKATELVIRSAFLRKSTHLSVIVAPFRALCHEISSSLEVAFAGENIEVEELSDSLQMDFDLDEFLGRLKVVVVTPEKLLYVLRQAPSLAHEIGLAIFDEGHQFDSGSRGIIYELLLTSLRTMLRETCQKILISAVISNANDICNWLNGSSNVISGANLHPTSRAIGFVSWTRPIGQINFVVQNQIDENEFFVPRIISPLTLKRLKGERVDRVFPDKSHGTAVGKEVALYLGIKLAKEGAVAIFCGTKDVATGILESAVDKYTRDLALEMPILSADVPESSRLADLVFENLGTSPSSESAKLGIFSHHGNTPHGIRLAVEHAMRRGDINFVVCTSTLAQGVNLPIRYLIVTSVYQGKEKIKVRDFHNLIGRAGRSGMHTEGSVILADPNVYDGKDDTEERWRWRQVRDMFDPDKSEPCLSNILSIFEQISSDDRKMHITWAPMDFVRDYLSDPDSIANFVEAFVQKHKQDNFSIDGVNGQISERVHLISSIESFLMAHEEESGDDYQMLASNTLAYHIADDARKIEILQLFRILAENIKSKIPSPEVRMAFGRTLFGVADCQFVHGWLLANFDFLAKPDHGTDFVEAVWQLISRYTTNKSFRKFDKPDCLSEITRQWISGRSFGDLLNSSLSFNARYIWGTKRRNLKVEHMVDICENGLAFDAGLAIGALIEFVGTHPRRDENDLYDRLSSFQKQLKYGLPSISAIAVFELGFADRVIALALTDHFALNIASRSRALKYFRVHKDDVIAFMKRYPRYYRDKMEILLSDG